MYGLHDVKITGISLDRILSCEIESQIGEHSTLTLQVRQAIKIEVY